jgi:hypothetical protein
VRYKTYNIKTGFQKSKRKISIAVAGLAALAFPAALALTSGGASAVAGYTPFGDATVVSGGNPGNALQLRSDASVAPGYGGANFNVPAGTTWASLSTLSTDYNVTDDDCGAGSPRFTIDVDTNGDNVADGDVVVAIGPSPSFTGCASGWQSTGNLIGNNDAGRYDFSHLGGSGFTTYSNAPAAVQSGTVLGISLVVDSSYIFPDSEQTILVDNVTINSDVNTFEPAPTVTVTIDKYVDGVQATAGNTSSSSFPMESSWTTTNIGSGTGNYDLGPNGANNPNPYMATTSNMSLGATYTTHELLGTTVAASCSPGGAPYSLVGYTTGNTLADAQGAVPSSTIPAFTNLQSNQFVVVWNHKCPTTPVFTHPTNKDQCKNDGWKTLYDVNNRAFKNQGDCVSYVATNGKNKANG